MTTYIFQGMTLPVSVQESINAYVTTGRPTGGFLEAVINNDLREAIVRADHINIRIIPAIVGYLYNECPAGCWGFSGAFDKWVEKHAAKRRLSNG